MMVVDMAMMPGTPVGLPDAVTQLGHANLSPYKKYTLICLSLQSTQSNLADCLDACAQQLDKLIQCVELHVFCWPVRDDQS